MAPFSEQFWGKFIFQGSLDDFFYGILYRIVLTQTLDWQSLRDHTFYTAHSNEWCVDSTTDKKENTPSGIVK